MHKLNKVVLFPAEKPGFTTPGFCFVGKGLWGLLEITKYNKSQRQGQG
jgi:hypothetical protein